LKNKYRSIEIITHARTKNNIIVGLIRSINGDLNHKECLFVSDLDGKLCVSMKKGKICQEYGNENIRNIIIVIKEIESWYLAGLNKEKSLRLKIKNLPKTDDISSADFDKIIPKKFDSRTDFLIEVIKLFSIDVARNKNKSFKYFSNKILN